jgi:outer membrane protein
MRTSRMVAVAATAAVCAVTMGSTIARADKPLDLSQPATKPGSHPALVRLTMDEAITLGLRNSRSLRSAAEAVWKARGMVNENRASYLPNLSATATRTHLDTGSSATIGSNTIVLAAQDTNEIDLTAGLPLDITGQIAAAVSAAQFQEIATRLAYNATRNEAVLSVKNAYLDVLRSKEYVTVAEQALKNAQDQQSTADAYLRAGTGTKYVELRSGTRPQVCIRRRLHTCGRGPERRSTAARLRQRDPRRTM